MCFTISAIDITEFNVSRQETKQAKILSKACLHHVKNRGPWMQGALSPARQHFALHSSVTITQGPQNSPKHVERKNPSIFKNPAKRMPKKQPRLINARPFAQVTQKKHRISSPPPFPPIYINKRDVPLHCESNPIQKKRPSRATQPNKDDKSPNDVSHSMSKVKRELHLALLSPNITPNLTPPPLRRSR